MPALWKLFKKINRLNVSASVYKFMSKELLIAALSALILFLSILFIKVILYIFLEK